MTDTPKKRCAHCGAVKPHSEFYLRHKDKPEGLRRSHCKDCVNAAARDRYRYGSVRNQIIRHSFDPASPLSPEAEKIVYTTEPADPVLVKRFKKRMRAKEARERALARHRAANPRPMRFARLEVQL